MYQSTSNTQKPCRNAKSPHSGKSGKIKNCMIEGMACPRSCIGGAGTNAGFAKTSKALKKYVDGSDPKIPSQELENLELN